MARVVIDWNLLAASLDLFAEWAKQEASWYRAKFEFRATSRVEL